VTAYESTAQILERQAAEHEAVTRAEADPSGVTEADLRVLPGEVTARLARDGKLVHLGFGAKRTGRRHP
jgi:hypothetical protein